MNTENFNHEANSLPEALGFNDDQYDEVMFKVMQIMKRLADGKQSERAAACMKWAYERFDTDELRAAAIFLMGQAVEKANMMASVHEMMSSGRSGLLDLLRQKAGGDAPTKVEFEDESNMKKFIKDFKSLVQEFNGEEVPEFGDQEGMMAIKLEPGTREEFQRRLNELQKKYGLEGADSTPFTMPFGGPIAEA